jgi:pimeloyl-ACP methyl ester carboxylesterase
MRRILLLCAAGGLATAAAAPANAAAAVSWRPCPRPSSLQCATVPVPVDRSGAAPGTIELAIYRARARGRRRGTLLLLPGGPGDSGLAAFARRLRSFDAIRATHDLVIVDPRGTGASGPLACGDAVACAAALGRASSLYTSRAVADDAEAVRAALGERRIALYGISYGTWFAQTYARLHPDRVSALVLDAPVTERAQRDPFETGKYAALPAALRAVCGRGACRGVSTDPWRDLNALAGRRLGGMLTDEQGRRRRSEVGILEIALATQNVDVNPALRASLPAALRAARESDPQPLLRLVAGGLLQPAADPRALSGSLNTVMNCEELTLPWERTTPFESRLAEARRRLAATRASFAPLTPEQALSISFIGACERWPHAPQDPLVTGPLPRSPTLVLSGDVDFRTPPADALALARATRGARLLRVRGTGHGVVAEDSSGCAARRIARFLAGGRTPPCGRVSLLGRPRFPRSLASVPASAVRGPRGARTRVIAAAVLTATDALNEAALRVDALRSSVARVRFGGLRGGRVAGRGGFARLSGAVLVAGVAVSGIARGDGRHDLRIRGALAGTLRVRGERATGRLGGRPVVARLDLRALGGRGVRVDRML